MTSHDHNPLLGLYGTPRAVIHSRKSARAKTETPCSEQEDPDKIGASIVSHGGLQDEDQTRR